MLRKIISKVQKHLPDREGLKYLFLNVLIIVAGFIGVAVAIPVCYRAMLALLEPNSIAGHRVLFDK